MYEFRRLLRASADGLSETRQLELVNLRSKLHRRLGYFPSFLRLEFEISQLSDEILSLEACAKRQRLAKWRQTVIDDDKALGRWLRSKSAPGACFIEGADKVGAACKLIHDFWSEFQNEAERVSPSVADRTEAYCGTYPNPLK